jgi:hypothetical protein
MSLNKGNISLNIEAVSAIFIIIFWSIFILANFSFGFILPLYVFAALISIAIAFLYPRSGLFAITFLTIIFERFFTLAPLILGRDEYKIYPLDIIIIAMIFGIFLKILQKKISVNWKNLDKVLVGFIILNAVYFIASFFIYGTDPYLAFSSFKNYSFYSLLFFIAFILLEKREDIGRLFNFFLSGVICIIGFIFFGAINGEGLWTEYTPLSTPGVRILAFTHGLYLSLALIPALIFIAYSKKSPKNFLLWLVLAWTIGIVGTMMRHLWVSLALSFMLIYFLLPKVAKSKFKNIIFKYIFLAFFLVMILVLAGLLAPNSALNLAETDISNAVWQRSASIANASSDESFFWRELVWTGAYQEFKNDPISGIGTGKTVYVENADYHDYVEVRNIHNSYLSIMIQLGIIGIGIFLFFLYKNIKSLVLFSAKGDNAFYKFSILGALFVYITALTFQPYLETNLLSIFFWMSLGIGKKISVNKAI